MPQVSQPLYCHNNPSLPGVGIRCRAEQYQQCSHKCEEASVHVAPGEIEIHLPESFFIQEKCHEEAHHIHLPGETVDAVLVQFLVVQQKYQDRESDGQSDSQGQIATILRPYMAKSKSDAAFLSLLRYEHSPELVEQIHKSRN